AAEDRARDRPHPPDPRAHVRAAPSAGGRPALRRGPDARRAGGADPPVAARDGADVRPPRDRTRGHLYLAVPVGPRAGAGGAAGPLSRALRAPAPSRSTRRRPGPPPTRR